MPDERRQNLAETDKGSYYNQEGWLEEFLDDKGAFYNLLKLMIVIMMMTIIMKKYWRIRLQMFFKIGILKNVWKFHRKTPVLQFLFIKVCNFRLQHRYFPMKFANFLRAPFFAEHLQCLLQKIMNSNSYLRVLLIVGEK